MSNENVAVAEEAEDTSGRMIGMISMAVAPGAILVSPTMFSLLGFFMALMGLTIAAPKQRIFSIGGIALALVCGAIGQIYHTPLI
jgi:uncharacterized YccA/Bax inhibitor family protein